MRIRMVFGFEEGRTVLVVDVVLCRELYFNRCFETFMPEWRDVVADVT